MKTWGKVSLITVGFGTLAFLTGPMIWPPNLPVAPILNLVPFFLFLSVAESLAFGLGIAFLIYGWPVMSRLANGSTRMTWAMFVSIAWLLLNWWPHDNLHTHNGLNVVGLLFIEYGFHLTLIIAGGILALCFVRLLRPLNEAQDFQS